MIFMKGKISNSRKYCVNLLRFKRFLWINAEKYEKHLCANHNIVQPFYHRISATETLVNLTPWVNKKTHSIFLCLSQANKTTFNFGLGVELKANLSKFDHFFKERNDWEKTMDPRCIIMPT